VPHFRINDATGAEDLVKRFHYSHRIPGNVQIVGTWHEDGGLFGDFGPIIAAAFWSIPPTRWSEDVLELSRLVRREDLRPSLSGLIAACCDYIRRNSIADLLVSFADQQQGHHGGIYQACSWNYDGQRERQNDGILLDGVFWPGRSCNSKWGTRSAEKLRTILPNRNIEPHYDEGKHLYWRPLNRSGQKKAVRLGLRSVPYHKPMQAIA